MSGQLLPLPILTQLWLLLKWDGMWLWRPMLFYGTGNLNHYSDDNDDVRHTNRNNNSNGCDGRHADSAFRHRYRCKYCRQIHPNHRAQGTREFSIQ